MQNESKLIIGALALAVAGKRLEMPEAIDWSVFCRLVRAHSVGALVYDGLQKAGVTIPGEVQQQLRSMYLQTIFRDTQMEYVKGRLQAALEEAQIAHIFLKGAVLKYSYPEPALRAMCDMDVLVYASDFQKLDGICQTLGGEPRPGDGNHRNYAFAGGVHVEFHPNLLHHATPVGTGINPGWQYAKESPGAAKELTEEGLYLNTVCHLANHFVAGGVGIRFVLDVWVNRHLRTPGANRGFVESELLRFDLLEFARNIEHLADSWFGDRSPSPLIEELGEYIITSGSHGTSDRAILNAVSMSSGSRLSALMKKAFYPKGELEDRFPWCRNKPLLLPAAWCVRACKAAKHHRRQIAMWNQNTRKVTREQASAQKEKLAGFGIKQSISRHK